MKPLNGKSVPKSVKSARIPRTPGRIGDWTQTYLGSRFYTFDPRPDDINILDISHALANLCRFGGHTRDFYSVAQHSVMVSLECDREDALWGLLHDATEAYLVDLPRPIKVMPDMKPYRDAETALMKVIAKKFNLKGEIPESVHKADEVLLASEAEFLMAPLDPEWEKWIGSITGRRQIPNCWTPQQAERNFDMRFHELMEGGE